MTGDNAATIGLMGAVLYVGGLLFVQLWRRVTGANAQSDQASAAPASNNA